MCDSIQSNHYYCRIADEKKSIRKKTHDYVYNWKKQKAIRLF